MKHRTQRRRTSRIAGRPARDAWKHELYEAKKKQIIRKYEILKQMTREARKRIYHLGKLENIIQKNLERERRDEPRRVMKRPALVFLMCSIPLLKRWVLLNREWK